MVDNIQLIKVVSDRVRSDSGFAVHMAKLLKQTNVSGRSATEFAERFKSRNFYDLEQLINDSVQLINN